MELRAVIAAITRLLRPWPWALPALVALGVLAALMEGIGIGLLIPFFQTLTADGNTANTGGLAGWLGGFANLFPPESRIYILGGTIFALIFFKSAATWSGLSLSFHLNMKVTFDLRRRMIDHLLAMEYGRFSRRERGTLINTLGEQTARATDAISVLAYMLANVCAAGVFLCLLLLISWQLTIAMALAIAVGSAGINWFSRRANRLGEALVRADAELTGRAMGILSGMRMIRAFGQENSQRQVFASASKRQCETFRRLEMTAGTVRPLIEIFFVPVFFAVGGLGWALDVPVTVMLVFLIMVYRMQPHLRAIQEHRVELAGQGGAILDVIGLAKSPPASAPGTAGVPFPGLGQSIRFDRVSFRYPGEANGAPHVEMISLTIQKGRTVAIVGGSGAGKSTLINLLLGFYRPDSGGIMLDDRPLDDFDLASWRRHTAIAGQDADLLDGTIAENIAFGRPGASEADIRDAAIAAEAHGFIMEQAGGYESQVGERGLSLSGGERQRIGLARAILRDPDLLILDEATNALDSISEAAIQKTLARLQGLKTILVIAHRLSTVRNADEVVVLESGRIVEQGPPQRLLKDGGRFAALYDLQSGPAETGVTPTPASRSR